MPFSEAVYRELMRWGPVGRVGLPHYTSEDDIYKGYFIQKGEYRGTGMKTSLLVLTRKKCTGTVVIGNIW